MKYNWDKPNVESAVKNNFCYADVLRELNIPVRGRNSDTLKRKVKDYNIDISHFTFVPKGKGSSKKKNIYEYLKKDSHIKSYKLKQKLIDAGLKENKCENPNCGISSWLGKEIVCQLHHIDGDETNNELSNLIMLCPNCHSQTENYCGSANKVKRYCLDCGRELKWYRSQYCTSCAAKHKTVINWDSEKNNLEKLVKTKTNLEIASVYGVSEATIRRYRKKFSL